MGEGERFKEKIDGEERFNEREKEGKKDLKRENWCGSRIKLKEAKVI